MSYRPISKKERGEVLWKAKQGMALNLRELAGALGYSYQTLCQWRADGLPLVDGKLPSSEAWEWRKEYLAKHPKEYQSVDSVANLVPKCLR